MENLGVQDSLRRHRHDSAGQRAKGMHIETKLLRHGHKHWRTGWPSHDEKAEANIGFQSENDGDCNNTKRNPTYSK